MISKARFLKIIHFLIGEEAKQEELHKALKKYAPSDFTGFLKTDIGIFILDFLQTEMNDTDNYIGWWLYDCPKRGKCEDDKRCTIWLGDIDNPDTDKVVIRTPEDLYDFLITQTGSAPSKESLDLTKKAQDNGVKFALQTINQIKEKNSKTRNPGWEERQTLMQYLIDKITNTYLAKAGVNRDLNLDEDLHIISTLEES